LMLIDVPRITSIPGHEPAESIIAIGAVIGSTIFIPFLALVVCYTAVPESASNNLIFNGSTVGVFSLLFFVLVSYGSGGVTKCEPYSSTNSSFIFIILVVSYFTALYIIELMNFVRNPFSWFFSGVEVASSQTESNGLFSRFKINWWRIPGAALNGVIILSTIAFSSSDVHSFVGLVFIIVMCMHLPLIMTIKFNFNQAKSIPTAVVSGIEPNKGSYEAVPNDATVDPQNNMQSFPMQPVNDTTVGPQNNIQPFPRQPEPMQPEPMQPEPMQPGIFAPPPPAPMPVFPAPPITPTQSNYFSSDRSYGDALRVNAGIKTMNNNSTDSVTRQRRIAVNVL